MNVDITTAKLLTSIPNKTGETSLQIAQRARLPRKDVAEMLSWLWLNGWIWRGTCRREHVYFGGHFGRT
jgi:hypothetical protein